MLWVLWHRHCMPGEIFKAAKLQRKQAANPFSSQEVSFGIARRRGAWLEEYEAGFSFGLRGAD